MAKRNLDFIGSKEPSWTCVRIMTEPKVIWACVYKKLRRLRDRIGGIPQSLMMVRSHVTVFVNCIVSVNKRRLCIA